MKTRHCVPLLLWLLLCLLIGPQVVTSQVPGCPNVNCLYNYPPKGMWPQGSVVYVNIDPTFTTNQQDDIILAMYAWNTANGYYGNNCGVTLLNPTFNPNPQGSSFNSYNL